MKKELDKKGQQMTLSTIIIIVLGILVLVMLIYGFTTGWSNFMKKIGIYSEAENNVDAIRTQCDLACQSGKESYAYKTQEREVTANGTTFKATCAQLVEGKNSMGGNFSVANLGIKSC